MRILPHPALVPVFACAVEGYDPPVRPPSGPGPSGTCSNSRLDAGETDVDCGGGCNPCALGRSCNDDTDCQSDYCAPGYVCRAASCGNGAQDPGETLVDCGGTCPACDGHGCSEHADCAGGYCQTGTCGPATCFDGVTNGYETDTDCGGPACSSCSSGDDCRINTDCSTGFCAGGSCSQASCDDGVQNQDESDVDCGGACADCAIGRHCNSGSDCVTGFCNGDTCTEVQASCFDGIDNGAESDVDCGGPVCDPCLFGEGCQQNSDCRSELCTASTCDEPATCEDGSQGSGETDIDCGGVCRPCSTGKYCDVHADCLSETCIYGVCENPTCSDEVQNQGEADVDCGGPCPACADGMHCFGTSDCQSGQCELNVCISCTDGEQNGTESDIDCGGNTCAGCADGYVCREPGDCTHGACELDVCCTSNPCGACAATPEEICDGIDNDCDSLTDEMSDIGPAPLCDEQDGVCAGSVAECRGFAGWVCDATTFGAHHAAYETTESTCDFLDNDCDAQTDEGLRNACDTCGPAPAEVCNGFDDNCDGSVDEVAACGLCSSTVTAHNLYNVDSGWGWQKHWSHWMAMLGDEAYVLFYPRGNTTSTHLVRCGDGEVQSDYKPGIPSIGNMSIAAGGGSLHVGAVGYPINVGFRNQYLNISSSGAVLATETVAPATNISGAPAAVAWGDGRAWLGYWNSDQGARYSRRGDDGTWVEQGMVPDGSYGMQLVIDGDGDAWSAWSTDPYDPAAIQTRRIGDSSNTTLCTTGCSSPALWVAPDGYPAVVYVENSSVMFQRFNGSSWDEAQTVGNGTSPNLGFLPNGAPVVSFVKSTTQAWVATYNGESWEEELAFTTTREYDHIIGTAIGADSAGRYHVALSTYTGQVYSDRKWIDYFMFCPTWTPACTPSCGAAECGPDGCGGSCGTCSEGTCVGGTCQNGSGACGADPSQSCNGACGGQGSGDCWCNASCVSYGDCCSDYATCCN